MRWIEFKSLYGKIWTCYETKWLLHHASPTSYNIDCYCILRAVFHSLAFDASVHFDIAEVQVNKFIYTNPDLSKEKTRLSSQPTTRGCKWMLLCCKVFSLTSPFTFLCDDIMTSRSPGKKHPILPTAWPWAGSAKQRSLEIMQEKNKKLAIFLSPFELLVGLYHMHKLVRKRSTTYTHMCSLHTAFYISKTIMCLMEINKEDPPGVNRNSSNSKEQCAPCKILQNPNDYLHI